jgi:hypothetical protein
MLWMEAGSIGAWVFPRDARADRSPIDHHLRSRNSHMYHQEDAKLKSRAADQTSNLSVMTSVLTEQDRDLAPFSLPPHQEEHSVLGSLRSCAHNSPFSIPHTGRAETASFPARPSGPTEETFPTLSVCFSISPNMNRRPPGQTLSCSPSWTESGIL